jgi:L-methionine (R)-S-oxide reductase
MIKNEKTESYELLLKNASALIDAKDFWMSKLANMAALLHDSLGNFWTGFYTVENDQLCLGPFQGPIACTTIAKGKGVCGTAWQTASSMVVDDVHKFPGHIACSAQSNSEIVVPIIAAGKVVAVLDIDSVEFAHFDETDKIYLEKLVALLI